jgi:hypothetical protein
VRLHLFVGLLHGDARFIPFSLDDTVILRKLSIYCVPWAVIADPMGEIEPRL